MEYYAKYGNPSQMMQVPQQAFDQFMHNPKLAVAYVPFQYIASLYPPMEGLKKGTIFPELDRPYGKDPEYTVDA